LFISCWLFVTRRSINLEIQRVQSATWTDCSATILWLWAASLRSLSSSCRFRANLASLFFWSWSNFVFVSLCFCCKNLLSWTCPNALEWVWCNWSSLVTTSSLHYFFRTFGVLKRIFNNAWT
jgi:hypothetical protein